MDHKEMAAREAVKYIEDGMVVGLGSGSTASIAIRLIGEKIKSEGIDIIGIPTSRASDLLGRAVGVKIGELDDHPHVDITIDGADEVGPRLNLVKGLGGALLREKIVAAATQLELIVVDESKLVEFIGQKSALPVEIAKFSHKTTMLRLASLGCTPVLRMTEDAPYVTDNGNYIADCRFQKIADPAAMEIKIDHIPGVVESGLFIGLTSRVIVGSPGGTKILEKQCML